ncbi:MAG: VWA domain-containing protein [Myxococcales bacterium]|nr:VWA domain-containing protein [Myxococcales bacterium]
MRFARTLPAPLALLSLVTALSLAGCGGAGMPYPSSFERAPAQAAVAEAPDGFDREGYDPITENGFFDPRVAPLSTFSIDVDTASYANVRRFLNQGRLPPPDAVRIEEMINYFDYAYPEAAGPHPFSVVAEVSAAPWNPAHRLVHVGVQGQRIDLSDVPPSNLVFLLDVSGSMGSPDKLPLLQQAFALLVEQLRPQDRVAIVVYAGAAGLVLDSTGGDEKGVILDALGSLSAGGSTAGGAGIELAYAVAQRNFVPGGTNRVVLATDGDFNVGVSSDGGLVRLIEQKRASGVFLTVLGFGTGNYQDAKMEKLSNAGNGNAAYIDSLLEARKVLVHELGGTLVTIAKDVKIQVEFNPAEVAAYRLIGYENRLLDAQDFADDRKDAGELGAGHSVTALYEVVPAGQPVPGAGVDALRYQKRAETAAAGSGELATVKLRYKAPEGDTSTLVTGTVRDEGLALGETTEAFRFASAVAELGLLLRGSAHRGNASYASVVERARGALGADRHGYRRDFVALAERAAGLAR